ncbi:unnamed protein product [Porites lobata]|uniref:Uncharacterized protein n=1 Tax=Porites lobata TaxID=104759 RepID=A0ABN8NY73_9CNID|nr:unnamed protein product [Porites lobata]
MAAMVVPQNAVKNWEKSGKDEVYRLCKTCVRGELSDSNFQCGENGLIVLGRSLIPCLFFHRS